MVSIGKMSKTVVESLEGDVIRGTVICSFKPPEEYRKRFYEDVAEAYVITENDEADLGIMVYARYHGKWFCNPMGTRPLIRHLLEKLEIIKQRS